MTEFIRLSTRQKVSIARFLNRFVRLGRAAFRRPMHGEFERGGLRWSLDLNEGIDFAIYLLGAFEHDLIRSYQRLIQPGATVLDIGANIGAHTLRLAQHVGPNGRVVAIEATEYACTKLRRNLSLNPEMERRVTIAHSMLVADGDTPIETAIHSSWPLAGDEKTHDVLCGALKAVSGARIVTLDILIKELGLVSVDWIKLDVDGHELPVLRGARECLAKYKPGIFMELAPYCYADEPAGFSELVNLLTNAGYVFFRLPDKSPLTADPTKLTQHEIPHQGSINVLALNTP